MKHHIFSVTGKDYRQIAPLFLRLVIGFAFMAHGWAKLSRGPEHFAQLLTLLHVPMPQIMAWLSVIIELLGGFTLFIGLFTGLSAVPLIFTMLVAMFTIHIHYGYSAVNTIGLTPHGPLFGPPGYEINLIYIAGLLVLIFSGAGKFSVDAAVAARKVQ